MSAAEPEITCEQCGAELEAIQAVCAACGAVVSGSPAQELLGQTLLGSYVVESVLGQGGMALVYRGRHTITEQAVAIKILPPELAVHQALKQRFLEEARALGKLEHPNIVRLYNFGEDRGRLCLVMQFVQGETFERRILDQGRVEPREAIRVIVEVLKALEYAHGAGIVHRDIKPSNILLQPPDVGEGVYVMDFGIARMMKGSQKLTETGQTMGTVRYMSPEQVRGQVVDHRSDLYSLGIALYEGLVGETPFEGDTHFDVMTKHLQSQPESPRARGVDIGPDVESALLTALRKDPSARFQSAKEMRTAFEAALSGARPRVDQGSQLTVPATLITAPHKSAAREASRKLESVSEGSDELGPDEPEPPVAAAIGPLERPITHISDEHSVLLEPPRRGKKIMTAAFLLALVGAGVFAYLRYGRTDDSVAALTSTGAPATTAGTPKSRRPHGKVPPHPVALSRPRKTDQSVDRPLPLRVIADVKVDPLKLASRFSEVVDQFSAYLKELKRSETIRVEPLTIAIVKGRELSQKSLWPGFPVDENKPYDNRYVPESSTYFVSEDAKLEAQLVYGFAWHLCYQSWASELEALTDCPALVSGFEDSLAP